MMFAIDLKLKESGTKLPKKLKLFECHGNS